MFITSNDHKYEEFSHAISKTEIRGKHYKMKYAEVQADTIDLVGMSPNQPRTLGYARVRVAGSG